MQGTWALVDLDRVETCGRYLVRLDLLVDQELEVVPEPVDDIDRAEERCPFSSVSLTGTCSHALSMFSAMVVGVFGAQLAM